MVRRAETSTPAETATTPSPAPGPSPTSGGPLASLLPAIPVFHLSFIRFLLVVGGITAGVVGTWNVERDAHLQDLRDDLSRKERVALELRGTLSEERKVYDGIAEDPRVERHLLESILGRDDDSHGIPIDRWLAGERFDPES